MSPSNINRKNSIVKDAKPYVNSKTYKRSMEFD